jgi:carboxyl-terminal processing protease
MTTARYFTPDGRSIQARGIAPDIEVRPATLTEIEGGPFFSEASLSGHLENGEGDIRPEDREGSSNPEIDRDYQLRSALNLLKGMGILSKRGDTAE